MSAKGPASSHVAGRKGTEIGISAEIEWTPTIVLHILVVSHHLFFLDEWGVGLLREIEVPVAVDR